MEQENGGGEEFESRMCELLAEFVCKKLKHEVDQSHLASRTRDGKRSCSESGTADRAMRRSVRRSRGLTMLWLYTVLCGDVTVLTVISVIHTSEIIFEQEKLHKGRSWGNCCAKSCACIRVGPKVDFILVQHVERNRLIHLVRHGEIISKRCLRIHQILTVNFFFQD